MFGTQMNEANVFSPTTPALSYRILPFVVGEIVVVPGAIAEAAVAKQLIPTSYKIKPPEVWQREPAIVPTVDREAAVTVPPRTRF
jgi:hypothetical protein